MALRVEGRKSRVWDAKRLERKGLTMLCKTKTSLQQLAEVEWSGLRVNTPDGQVE
jgi:hypothetical protein